MRDAQDARTKRQGLLDQYQELKEQRQRIVSAGPDGDLPDLRPAPRRRVREGARACSTGRSRRCVSNGNFYKQRIEQLQLEPPRRWTRRTSAGSCSSAELSEATGELGRLEAQAQESATL